MRIVRMLPSALVMLLFVVSISLTLLAPPTLWVDTFFDDAYYYLGVARNISLGNGSMFAPPLDTNGYQPLWLVILTGASFLVGADHRLLAAFAHFISAAAIVAFFAVAWKQEGKIWPAALTVIAFPAVCLEGMETVLIPVLALLYFRADGWKRGGLASLIFLTRLDAVGLIVGREIYQFLRDRTIDTKAGIVLLAVIAAYAALNYALFGTPVPISGLSKSIGSIPGENWLVGLDIIIGAIPIIFTFALNIIASRARKNLINPIPIFASMVALGCSVAYYSIFSGWIVWAWYLWPLSLLLYFVLLEFTDLPIGPARTGKAIVVAIIVVAGITNLAPRFSAPVYMALGIESPKISWGRTNVAMAEQISSSSLSSATFAMGDRAGSFGYLLPDRFHLVQTEGLVANLAYSKALREGTAISFLANIPVDYLIVDRGKYWVEGAIFAVPEPIQGLSARSGVMLLCFPSSAVKDFGKSRPERKVFVFSQRVPCPARSVALFNRRQQIYGEIRRTSLWIKRPKGFFGAVR